jgi:hypothetical protein
MQVKFSGMAFHQYKFKNFCLSVIKVADYFNGKYSKQLKRSRCEGLKIDKPSRKVLGRKIRDAEINACFRICLVYGARKMLAAEKSFQ